MKKIIISFLFALLLVGCSTTYLTTNSNDATTTTPSNRTTTEENAQEKFKINVKNEGIIVKELNVPLSDLENKTLFEIVEKNFDIKYTESSYGIFIHEIEGLKGKDLNYYVQINLNQIPSNVGISEIQVKNKDEITFSISTYLSEFDQKIDSIIYDFITKKLKNVDVSKVDYSLLSCLNLMESSFYNVKVNDYINKADYANYLTNYVISENSMNKQNDIYKLILNAKNTENDYTRFMDIYKGFEIHNFTDNAIPFGYISLHKENSPLKTDLENAVFNFDFTKADVDTSCYYMIAMSYNKTHLNYQEKLEEAIFNVFAKGSILGFDNWGKNSCSTSLVISALAANNLDFTSDNKYKIEGETIIQILMKYYVENEGFKWNMDGVVDNRFATPQCMSALMIYKLYRDNYTKVAVKLFR